MNCLGAFFVGFGLACLIFIVGIYRREKWHDKGPNGGRSRWG